HAEMPFFFKVDNDRCIEGVIDLAFFERNKGKCLILDWKTDRVPPDNTETLHARYRPQLAAYWKAVSEITKLDVEAAIYSTAAGALVRYKTEELAREWSRLEKLPPDQFDVEVTKELPVSATKPGPTKSEQLEFAEL
ncbi:MAG: nuclease superfamily, partial [Verrucomicrobiota bacterium]